MNDLNPNGSLEGVTDPENWNVDNDVLINQFLRRLDVRMREYIKPTAATHLSAGTVQLPSLPLTGGQPVQILGLDLKRTRTLIIASVPDIFIGSYADLGSSAGAVVPTGGYVEVKATDEIYAMLNTNSTPLAAPRISFISEWND